jgi:hypothetical protein
MYCMLKELKLSLIMFEIELVSDLNRGIMGWEDVMYLIYLILHWMSHVCTMKEAVSFSKHRGIAVS